ncbi:MAG: aspartate 4-decarboxylase [Acidaminobacter sp.]|uniref:aspartate 4-decarboxylase n=1 Tax=Acidaminobacter sp. TaxID=1872102 RepID=UPI001380BFE0|nr:aspartate 4-decarboxylase [Acidaminobacter sp.]MZQ99077.1 aspartate 4-decarboxylase [Acidaminobacter sp.]
MSKSIQREEIENIYGKVSPFELKDKLISYASEARESGTRMLLDAGRGNPNWTASTPRDAFFTFGHFAVEETRRTYCDGALAGMPQKSGIAERFYAYADRNSGAPGITLLKQMMDYGISFKGFDPDDFVHELVDGIIGDNYPFPDRMLRHSEQIVLDYLVQELKYDLDAGQIKLYAVEGATAAMCYIFDTLIANNIFSQGDTIALMTPIFTPYLEIPHLPRYNFKVVEIKASELNEKGENTWQYPKSEMDKLRDPSIRALFIVNPSNPPSVAINKETISYLSEIVKEDNPDLMIISDDVYGTFVEGFSSLMREIPYNTIGAYSFSKYFGVTGWRLGTIALHEDNVFDRLLGRLDENKKARARRRYSALSIEPESIAFMDRIVADSRQVALNHTAGLSTPQQVQMVFFCLFALIDRDNIYKKQTISLLKKRQRLLFEGLGIELREDPNDAAYYTQFDLLQWATQNYGEAFASYLQNNYKPVDILLRLAEESSIVLLSGGGFSGPEWSIRISLANLSDESYSTIGAVTRKILNHYVAAWKESQAQ